MKPSRISTFSRSMVIAGLLIWLWAGGLAAGLDRNSAARVQSQGIYLLAHARYEENPPAPQEVRPTTSTPVGPEGSATEAKPISPSLGKASSETPQWLLNSFCREACSSFMAPNQELAESEKLEGVPRAVRFIGQFHVAVVHFPIALILAAGLAEFLFLLSRRAWLGDAARFLVLVAAPAAAVAVTLGWCAEAFSNFLYRYQEVIETHEAMAVSTTITIIITAILSELARRSGRDWLKLLYRIGLAVAVVLVAITGYFGGELVHGLGHYQW